MNRKQNALILSGALFIGSLVPAFAEIDLSLLEMTEQMDGIDQQDFNSSIGKANVCISSRNFTCAEYELANAGKAANSGQDKKSLLASRNALVNEKQQLALEIKRAEEERQAKMRRDEEERQAQLRRDEEREARLRQERQEAQDKEDRRSTAAYKAQLFRNMQNDFSKSMVRLEAVSRGSSVEQDRAKARRQAEFNNIISNMEADPNSDLNRDKRARELQHAEAQKADAEWTAKREAAKRVALADDEKRTNDKRAQADVEASARKKQQADELRAQQERDKQRADAERRNQELRDEAERKRVVAAEEAKQKAEKERQAQAEQQDRAQYLQKITAGTRLVATMCPGGEGKYFATGTRPKIKPEKVSCVDVRYRAYCPGSRQYSEGIAQNFIGMSGCFGDTYDITPKPGCKVDQVRIEIVDATECRN